MILLCNPRSGSVWFFSCLTNIPYSHSELFNFAIQRSRAVHPYYVFKNVSLKAKLAMIKNNNKKFWKIFFSDLDLAPTTEDRHLLIDALQGMDLYCLSRSDFKKSIVSVSIAVANNWNFHGPKEELVKPFKLTQEQVHYYYQVVYGSYLQYKNLFQFKEEFSYEDLVSGAQTPKSFDWDKSRSTVIERNSMDHVHLIENWDQVETWIDQLPR